MAESGVNYYLDTYSSFEVEPYWKVWYSFKDVQNGVVPSISGANSSYSGVYAQNDLFNTPDYLSLGYGKTGVGISNITGFDYDAFSLIFLAQKLNKSGSILFTCAETGTYNGENVNKGFSIGYNDAGNIFFEYYHKGNPRVYTSSFIPYKNHSIYVIKNGQDLILGNYNFISSKTQQDTFSIDDTYILDPQKWYLGTGQKNDKPKDFYSHKYCDFLLDEFLCFDYPLYQDDIVLINSGFCSNYIDDYYVTGSGLAPSGTPIGMVTGMFSGVTGSQTIPTGVITDDFGNQYTGYSTILLSGLISGTGIGYSSGDSPFFFEELVTGHIEINTGFLKSMYPSVIVYTRPMDSSDMMHVWTNNTEIKDLDYNSKMYYDVANNVYQIDSTGSIAPFINGLFYNSGQKIISGSIYDPTIIFEGDYFQTGYQLDFTGFFQDQDKGEYRKIESSYYYYVPISHPPLALGEPFNSLLFLNGVNLIKQAPDDTRPFYDADADYAYKFTAGNNGLLVLNTSLLNAIGANSIFSVVYFDYLIDQKTGNSALFDIKSGSISGFNEFNNFVFLNGQYQHKDTDYLVTDKNSLLDKSGVFSISESTIYNLSNDNDAFMEH